MKFRLIIPQCHNFSGWWCENSKNIESRLEVLQNSMDNDEIDIIITSHNYFIFFPSCLVDIRKFVEKQIINHLLNKISSERRKPIILGFDILNQHIIFNPYSTGIDAVVCFIDLNNNGNYIYNTHIWECWEETKVGKKCSQPCFLAQNNARLIRFSNYIIGLLSCGDIARYCHDDGKLLPQVDIYIDLSHKSLKGDTSQLKVPPKIVNEWGKADMVIVTQQVKNVNRYQQKKYPYIFYNNKFVVNININKYTVGDEKGAYIDIQIKQSNNPFSGSAYPPAAEFGP